MEGVGLLLGGDGRVYGGRSQREVSGRDLTGRGGPGWEREERRGGPVKGHIEKEEKKSL